MTLRQALAGQPCPRFGDGEADEGEAPSVTPKRNARHENNASVTPPVTHDAKLTGRIARLEGEVAALRSQVAMLMAAMAEPKPDADAPQAKVTGNAARQAAYRKRQREAKG